MDDLKHMTVRALRELARQHLGSGHSRLKTKAQLVDELTKALQAQPAAVEETEPEAVAPMAKAEPVVAGAKVEAKPAAPIAAPLVEAKPAAPIAAPVVKAQPKPSADDAPSDSSPDLLGAAQLKRDPDEEPPAAQPAKAEPPVAEPQAVERVKSQAELDLLAEDLGDLPASYEDDSLLLLSRDPHTLWVSWDVGQASMSKTRSGLENPRSVLRLYEGPTIKREIDVSLEARSWYLFNVEPGKRYRAEIAWIARDGESRRALPASNPAVAPPEGPSPIVDDKFVRLPPEIPFQRAPEVAQHAHAPSQPFPESLHEQIATRTEAALRGEPVGPEVASGPAPATPREPGAPHVTRTHLGGSEQVQQTPGGRTQFGGIFSSSRFS